MPVHGLWDYCLSKRSRITTVVKLPVKTQYSFVVDLNSLAYFILYTKALPSNKDNLWIAKSILAFVNALSAFNARLYFVTSSHAFSRCGYHDSLQKAVATSKHIKFPLFWQIETVHLLKENGYSVSVVDSSVYVQTIASMVVHDGFSGVLTENSDFFCIPGMTTYPICLITLKQFSASLKEFTTPRVAYSLQLSQERLFDVAVVCGNSFTADCLIKNGFAGYYGFDSANGLLAPKQLVDLIWEQRESTFEINPIYRRLRRDGAFADGYDHSLRLYQPEGVKKIPFFQDPAVTVSFCGKPLPLYDIAADVRGVFQEVVYDGVNIDLWALLNRLTQNAILPATFLSIGIDGVLHLPLAFSPDTSAQAVLSLTRPLRQALYAILSKPAVTESHPKLSTLGYELVNTCPYEANFLVGVPCFADLLQMPFHFRIHLASYLIASLGGGVGSQLSLLLKKLATENAKAVHATYTEKPTYLRHAKQERVSYTNPNEQREEEENEENEDVVKKLYGLTALTETKPKPAQPDEEVDADPVILGVRTLPDPPPNMGTFLAEETIHTSTFVQTHPHHLLPMFAGRYLAHACPAFIHPVEHQLLVAALVIASSAQLNRPRLAKMPEVKPSASLTQLCDILTHVVFYVRELMLILNIAVPLPHAVCSETVTHAVFMRAHSRSTLSDIVKDLCLPPPAAEGSPPSALAYLTNTLTILKLSDTLLEPTVTGKLYFLPIKAPLPTAPKPVQKPASAPTDPLSLPALTFESAAVEALVRSDPFGPLSNWRSVLQDLPALPIDEYGAKIITTIYQNRITSIQGNTGCGKSSRVPLFIRAAHTYARVIVTQPRRITAIALAGHVARTLGEDVGQTVGYAIGGEHTLSPSTRIAFVTTGWLLQLLTHDPDKLKDWTHVVLDEAHERGKDSDLLALILKLTIPRAPSTRIVVMSATLHSDLFSDYFSFPELPHILDCPVYLHGKERQRVRPASYTPLPYAPNPERIFVGVSRFSTEYFYPEDLVDYRPVQEAAREVVRVFAPFDRHLADGFIEQLSVWSLAPELYSETVEMAVTLIAHEAKPDATILVFLPGMMEISVLAEALLDMVKSSCGADGDPNGGKFAFLSILPLHSEVSREDQLAACSPPPAGVCNVVLSTDIAESSLTIASVHVVIDFGLHKEIRFDHERRVQHLSRVWCSKASAVQRGGRAGRVAPGKVYRLYSKTFLENAFDRFTSSEMVRMSAASFVLTLKTHLSHFGRASDLLKYAIEIPPDTRLREALDELYDAGATEGLGEDAKVTYFGAVAEQMPLNLTLSRLLLFGLEARMEPDAIVIAAGLSLGSVLPKRSRVFKRSATVEAENIVHIFREGLRLDRDRKSDALAIRDMYIQYVCKDTHCGNRQQLQHFKRLVLDVCEKILPTLTTEGSKARVQQLMELSRSHAGHRSHARVCVSDLFSDQVAPLSLLLAGGLAATFVQGRVKLEPNFSDIPEKEGIDPLGCVVLSEIADHWTPPAISQGLARIGCKPRSVRIRTVPGWRNSVDADGKDVVEEIERRICVLSYPPETTPVSMDCPVEDAPLAVRHLFQFTRGGVLRVVNSRGEFEDLGCPTYHHTLAWRFSNPPDAVYPQGGSVLNKVTDWSPGVSGRPAQSLAVCGIVMGGNKNTLKAEGLSLLTKWGCLDALSLLCFAPPSLRIRMTYNRKTNLIHKVLVGPFFLELEPLGIDHQALTLINTLREVVSRLIIEGPDTETCLVTYFEQIADVCSRLEGIRKVFGNVEGALEEDYLSALVYRGADSSVTVEQDRFFDKLQQSDKHYQRLLPPLPAPWLVPVDTNQSGGDSW